ncbi:DNA-binding protein [Solimonas sp. SE-A11]|uniref:DNA-binding protein n=1 Tax=Solimonas sp. SE-A11 TaxID=3054954 RepID=UPI00259CD1D5|nr:DNA-binding protein [Solimonas sp. SE-A11]MDM4771164.1 DNA-binding protein [Solimonas sp. SE-A11]
MGNTVIPDQDASALSLEERVHAAADVLRRDGRKVTAESVRQAIGGGSLRDICPALRRWRELTESPSEATSSIPPEVARAFREVETKVWSMAEARVAERIAITEAAGASKIAMANVERDEALEDNERLEQRLASAEKMLVASREAERQADLARARAEGERGAALQQLALLTELLAAERNRSADAQRHAAELQGRFAAMAEAVDAVRAAAPCDR